MKLKKVDKVLKMAQLLGENPDITAMELARHLNMNIRTVYNYLKQFQQVGIPTTLRKKKQDVIYDEVELLTTALSQPQLSVIHKSVEALLQNPKGLTDSEICILKEIKELISKALWAKPQLSPISSEAEPASIKLLFEPTKGKYEGEVRLGFIGKFEFKNAKNKSVTPLHLVSSINVNFLNLIFSALFCYCKGKPEGMLVKLWEVSDDLLTWSFDLEERVKFHNGKELTTEDVTFTYQCITDPEFDSPLSEAYSFVEGFEVISKYKFQIRLKQPHVALLDRLGISILPKEVLQRYRQRKSLGLEELLIGTGPFKFDSFPQDDVIVLKANENYFEEGYPHLERVILKLYPTSKDLFNAISKGEVDLGLFALMVSELGQLAEANEAKAIPFQIHPFDILAYYALLFNLKDKTLSDLRVRKAISHAIDRESLLKRQLKGYGRVSNGPWMPPSWAHNEGLQPIKYDLELAKSLLKEAGWKERRNHWQKGEKEDEKLELEIAVVKEIPDFERLAAELKLELSNLKVKVKLRDISSIEIAPNSFQTALLNVTCGGDPDKLRRFWHSESKTNLTSYRNPEVDELLDWGRSLVSMSKRKAIYDRIQELIVADHPAAFLCTSVYFLGSNLVLENLDKFLTAPGFFSSIKSWTIERREERR